MDPINWINEDFKKKEQMISSIITSNEKIGLLRYRFNISIHYMRQKTNVDKVQHPNM